MLLPQSMVIGKWWLQYLYLNLMLFVALSASEISLFMLVTVMGAMAPPISTMLTQLERRSCEKCFASSKVSIDRSSIRRYFNLRWDVASEDVERRIIIDFQHDLFVFKDNRLCLYKKRPNRSVSLHGSKDKGLQYGVQASADLLRSCSSDRRKPDSFEPGGSGRLPKQPFQPLACALFSSQAFPLLELAPASAPPAPWGLWLPWLLLSRETGVRGNYLRCSIPTSF